MKAVIYVRVSTMIQDNQRQIDDITKYCSTYDLTVVETFAEKESGTKDVRVELTKLKNYIKDNTIDYVVISELSRLGRTKEVLNSIDYLHDNKVGLISLKEGIKSLNPDKSLNVSSQLIIGILSALNSYELTTMKYRTRSGIRKSFADGKSIGDRSIAYGYKKDGTGKLIIDEIESELVKRMFGLYLTGSGTLKIAKLLNTENIKPRRCKRWTDGVIYAILKNTIYVGKRRFKNENDKIDTLDFPNLRIIIDNSSFEQVQKMLSDNAHKGANNTYNYLLPSTKMICGCCGKTYRPLRNAKGTNKRFMCAGERLDENCGNFGIGIDKFESAINAVAINKMDLQIFKSSNNSDHIIQIEGIKNEIKGLNDELIVIQKKESKLVNMKLNDDLSDETYNELIKEIRNNKIHTNKKITYFETELKEMEENLKNMTDINYYLKTGKKLDSSIINKMISKVIIYPELKLKIGTRKDNKVIRCEIQTIYDYKNVTFFVSQRSNKVKILGSIMTIDLPK